MFEACGVSNKAKAGDIAPPAIGRLGAGAELNHGTTENVSLSRCFRWDKGGPESRSPANWGTGSAGGCRRLAQHARDA
jgi:hypothetical protein